MSRAQSSRFCGLLSCRIPILVVHFLELLEGASEFLRHHLNMFRDVAVLAGVRMGRFENHHIATIQSPSTLLTQRCKRPLFSKLSPMTLAIAKSEMAFGTSQGSRIRSWVKSGASRRPL